MEWVRGTAELKRSLERPVLTIGNFDGLHAGHRAIMDTVVTRARDLSGEAVVYTFEGRARNAPSPMSRKETHRYYHRQFSPVEGGWSGNAIAFTRYSQQIHFVAATQGLSPDR